MPRTFPLLAATLLALAVPRISEAVYLINSCNPTQASPNTNAKLNQDITCNPANGDVGVTLNSGADLDMNGKTITCATGQTCGAAVTLTSSSSVVSGPGTIAESFQKIVDCAGKGGARVTSVKFRGATTSGMYNCLQLDQNVFVSTDGSGAAVTTTTATSPSFTDNYIDGFDTGILYTGSVAGGTVSHNMFNGPIVHPIVFQNWASAAVTDNVFLEDDGVAYSAIDVGSLDAATYSGNVCDTNSSGCSLCVTAGRCSGEPSVPFGF